MKKGHLFVVAVIVSLVLLQSAKAYPRGGGRSFSSAPHFSAPAHHYSAPSRSFSSGSARYSASARYSSMNRSSWATRPRFSPTTTALRNPTYVSRPRQFAGDRTEAFNSRIYSRSSATRNCAAVIWLCSRRASMKLACRPPSFFFHDSQMARFLSWTGGAPWTVDARIQPNTPITAQVIYRAMLAAAPKPE